MRPRDAAIRAVAVPGGATIRGSRAEVAEWQTRRSQTPLRATSCGFESHLRYHQWHTHCPRPLVLASPTAPPSVTDPRRPPPPRTAPGASRGSPKSFRSPQHSTPLVLGLSPVLCRSSTTDSARPADVSNSEARCGGGSRSPLAAFARDSFTMNSSMKACSFLAKARSSVFPARGPSKSGCRPRRPALRLVTSADGREVRRGEVRGRWKRCHVVRRRRRTGVHPGEMPTRSGIAGPSSLPRSRQGRGPGPHSRHCGR